MPWPLPLALLAALTLAGCGGQDAPTGTTPERGAPPLRIVPASAGVVDLVTALVPAQRIAGLPRQAFDYSGVGADAALAERPRFDAYAAEPLLALAPDLVIADRWQSADTTGRLRAAGISVLVLDDLESLPSVRRALEQLGAALGAETECVQVLARLDERVARLAEEAPRRMAWRALAYTNGGGGGWVAGAGTTADEWIRLAGLTNAGAEGGRQGHVGCSFEDLLTLDPDLIVIAARGGEDGGATAQVLQTEPVLARLAAVRNGRVVALDASLFSCVGPHLVTAAESLARSADEAMAP